MTTITDVENTGTPTSVRTASLTAGIALAVMAVLAPAGLLVALPAGLTGVAALAVVVVAALDVVVGLTLGPVVATGGALLVRTACALRIVYAAVFATAAGSLVGPRTDVDRFQSIWDMSLVMFSAHLLLVGLALIRSRLLPTWLGILVLVAGLGYLCDGIVIAVTGQPGVVGQFTFFGELALCVWLLAWGGRPSRRPQSLEVPGGMSTSDHFGDPRVDLGQR